MRALTGHEVEPTLIMREAKAGDRYLLCSDGLSDPVSHETIHEALQIEDVAESADRLIELALRGGGPDNVTVVVADVVDYDYGQTQPILAGAVSGDDDQTAPPDTAAGRASAFNPRRNEPKRVVPQPAEPARRPRSRRRFLIAAVLLVLVLIGGLAIGREIIRNNYYVAEHDGTVSIMRGVQGSFLGISLQEPYRLGCLNARNELSLISADDTQDQRECRLMAIDDSASLGAGLGEGRSDRRHPGRGHRADHQAGPELRPAGVRPAHRHHDVEARPDTQPGAVSVTFGGSDAGARAQRRAACPRDTRA